MKIILSKLSKFLKSFIYPFLIKKSRENKFSFTKKLELLTIHKFYSNYQPMELDKWEKDKSKRNVVDRLKLIEKNLEGKSILDIGSHSGYFSLKLAQKGYFVIGLDQDQVILRKANLLKNKYHVNNVSFLHYPINIGSVEKLPVFDNVIYLSIHHHMIKVYGYDLATQIFKTIARKTKYKLFFDFPYPKDFNNIPLFKKMMPDMGENPDTWLKEYLIQVGFNKVKSLQILGHNEKPNEKRNLLMAQK